MSKEGGFSVPVDLIRTLAIIGVILLHATNDLSPGYTGTLEITRWLTVDVYQSIARMSVPLFVMLTGALLLQPSKTDESLGSFFKKRLARLALPFFFWGALYYVWLYFTENKAITVNSVVQGYLTSPYLQFWYIYMLAGLYLLTPILRIVVGHADRRTMQYFIILWFVGTSVVPLVGYFTGYNLDANLFAFTGWIGYFLLGTYLLEVKLPRVVVASLMALGVALAAIGTVYMAYAVGGGTMYYFQEYLSPTMILASVMCFLLLNTIRIPPYKHTSKAQTTAASNIAPTKPSPLRRLMHLISINTLPIFLLHLIVLESLLKGYLGFAINGAVINSIVGVPLLTALTLLICLAIILPLKKIPYLKQLIG